MNPTIASQAAQAAQQGQQQVNQDLNTASQSQGQYNTAQSNLANTAQQQQAQTQYMQGAGSGQNVYNTNLQNLTQQYDPNLQGQLSSANQSLFGLSGALNGANQQFNTAGGVGAYGLSAPALAGYESSVMQPLQTGVSNANTQVGTLNNQLQNFMTGASQATTGQVQSEQNVVTNLQQTAATYQDQASSALSNMQFYSQLASTQGGLNAQEAQNYALSQQNYTQAQANLALINQYNTQAAFNSAQATGQGLTNQQTQAAITASATKAAQTAAAQQAQQQATALAAAKKANPYAYGVNSEVPQSQPKSGLQIEAY